MERSDDRALLEELAAGSEAALAAVYERHRRPVYAQGFVETRSRSDAEEVLQDAFLLLWQKRRSIVLVGGSALPWLLITARNLARNRRRYQGRRATSQLREDTADHRSDPARIVMKHELAELLEEAMAGLDPLDRRIVQHCLVDGMTYREAAEQLQSTHATVRNRLGRARRMVRLRLESEHERGSA